MSLKCGVRPLKTPAPLEKPYKWAQLRDGTRHWSLDMTYREDESRIRDPHIRENFAWLNRFTLSLLKQHPGKDSIVMKRRGCGWNENFMLEVLTGATL